MFGLPEDHEHSVLFNSSFVAKMKNVYQEQTLTRTPEELHRYRHRRGVLDWSYDLDLKREKEKKINSNGKVITDLDALVFVVNITHRHWQVIAVFPEKKKIEVFDSLGR